MKAPRFITYRSPLGPHLEQIRCWRRARKTWRKIGERSRKISDVCCAIISALQLRRTKAPLSEIVSGGVQ